MDILKSEMLDLVNEFPPHSKVFYTKENRGGIVRGYFCAGETMKIIMMTKDRETFTLEKSDLEKLDF